MKATDCGIDSSVMVLLVVDVSVALLHDSKPERVTTARVFEQRWDLSVRCMPCRGGLEGGDWWCEVSDAGGSLVVQPSYLEVMVSVVHVLLV